MFSIGFISYFCHVLHGADLFEDGGVFWERIELTRRLGLSAYGVEEAIAPLQLLHRGGTGLGVYGLGFMV